MHSKHYDGNTIVHHNGDYSGDVTIIVPKDRSKDYILSDNSTSVGIKIPFEVFRSLTLDYLRNKTISNFESMTDDDLEEWFVSGWPSDSHTEKLTPGIRQSLVWMNEPHGHH